MRAHQPRGETGFIVLVSLIVVELLKVLFIPNPFDVMVLGGLVFVALMTVRR